MASIIAPPHITETRILELKLKPIFRKLLNNENEKGKKETQELICNEIKYNITDKPYTEYIKLMKDKLNAEKDEFGRGKSANITSRILYLLFDTYPEFERIKESLVLSTRRTAITTDSGLEGETAFHRDDIYFPKGKDSNLIITWGVGTEAATIDLSHLITRVKNHIITKFENERMYHTYIEKFKEAVLIKPSKTIDNILINATQKPDFFNKIVKEEYDKLVAERGKLYLDILSSESPNKEGNITALIMDGKEVYHRRKSKDPDQYQYPDPDPDPKKCAKPNKIYRYSLNIYFNAEDLQQATKTGSPAPKTGSPAPKTGSPAPKTGSPVPKTGSPAPKTGSPAPKTGSPATKTVSPKKKTSSGGQKNKTRKNKTRKNKTR